MSTYSAGQMIRFRWHFTNPETDAKVQTTATVAVTTPAAATTTYSGSLDSTDTSYYYDLDTTGFASGTYTVKFKGTGSYLGVKTSSFTIG